MAFDPTKYGATPIKGGTSSGPLQGPRFDTSVTPPTQGNGVPFQYNRSDNPLVTGLKAAGNVPASAFNLAKGVGSALVNPIETTKNLVGTAVGGVQKLIPGQQAQEQKFDNLVNYFKTRYGSLDALAKTATEDPFGFGTDVATLVSGGAGLAAKAGVDVSKATSMVNKAAKVAATPITKPIELAKSAVGMAGPATKTVASYVTGLNPKTIETAIKQPEALSAAQAEGLSRLSLGNKVKTAIQTRLDDLSSSGKEYNVIRENPEKYRVEVPPDVFSTVLEKYGLGFDGKDVITTADSIPLSPGDIQALTRFYNQYGKETSLSGRGFLNTRLGLDELGQYGQALDKTQNVERIARDLRAIYDAIGKNQIKFDEPVTIKIAGEEKKIKGLKDLDELYAPERKELGKLKDEYLNPDGTLNDTALTRIANSTNKGRDLVLERLQKLSPGIEEDINILRAIEDIEVAGGNKVGTYLRGGIGIAGGSLYGPAGALVGLMVTNPTIVMPILKWYGRQLGKAQDISATLYQKIIKAKELTQADKNFMRAAFGAYVDYLEEEGASSRSTDDLSEYVKGL